MALKISEIEDANKSVSECWKGKGIYQRKALLNEDKKPLKTPGGKDKYTFIPAKIGKIYAINDEEKGTRIVYSKDGSLYYFSVNQKQFREFNSSASIKKKLKIFEEASKGFYTIRKHPANRKITFRVSDELYNELVQKAENSDARKISDYCRQLVEGSQPRLAWTPEEKKLVMELVALRNDIKMYGVLMNNYMTQIGVPNDQRLDFIIRDEQYAKYDIMIKKACYKLDSLTSKNKKDGD